MISIGHQGGLYCYLITPFDDNGDVDYTALERLTDEVINCGADGVTCVASTTEGPYLTEAERFGVIETVCAAAKDRVPVDVGIGAVSTRLSQHYAEQAQRAGASTMIVELPTYMPEISFRNIKKHFSNVADVSDVPLRLYNIPRTTRIDLVPQQIADLAEIEQIDSVKDASGDARRIQEIKALTGDRFGIYTGLHFMALESYRYGAIGWEGAYHPLFGEMMVALHKTLRSGDFEKGQVQFERLEPLFLFFLTYGVPQCIKAMSEWTDLKLGSPRAPLSELNTHQTKQLRGLLTALGCL